MMVNIIVGQREGGPLNGSPVGFTLYMYNGTLCSSYTEGCLVETAGVKYNDLFPKSMRGMLIQELGYCLDLIVDDLFKS